LIDARAREIGRIAIILETWVKHRSGSRVVDKVEACRELDRYFQPAIWDSPLLSSYARSASLRLLASMWALQLEGTHQRLQPMLEPIFKLAHQPLLLLPFINALRGIGDFDRTVTSHVVRYAEWLVPTQPYAAMCLLLAAVRTHSLANHTAAHAAANAQPNDGTDSNVSLSVADSDNEAARADDFEFDNEGLNANLVVGSGSLTSGISPILQLAPSSALTKHITQVLIDAAATRMDSSKWSPDSNTNDTMQHLSHIWAALHLLPLTGLGHTSKLGDSTIGDAVESLSVTLTKVILHHRADAFTPKSTPPIVPLGAEEKGLKKKEKEMKQAAKKKSKAATGTFGNTSETNTTSNDDTSTEATTVVAEIEPAPAAPIVEPHDIIMDEWIDRLLHVRARCDMARVRLMAAAPKVAPQLKDIWARQMTGLRSHPSNPALLREAAQLVVALRRLAQWSGLTLAGKAKGSIHDEATSVSTMVSSILAQPVFEELVSLIGPNLSHKLLMIRRLTANLLNTFPPQTYVIPLTDNSKNPPRGACSALEWMASIIAWTGSASSLLMREKEIARRMKEMDQILMAGRMPHLYIRLLPHFVFGKSTIHSRSYRSPSKLNILSKHQTHCG
jgi:hypothetical protein